ncbi:unnamed protein product [Closterium sp. NIES-64]|nr:unnamed protein product [Closterium sp. NIES-64]
MDATFRNGDVQGLTISDKTNPLKPPCDSCLRGKMSKTPFPTGSTNATTRPLELVHSDIMDLGDAHPSLRYVLTLKDDYTNYLWVAPLARRSDMAAVFSAWHREMKTKLPKMPLAALRTDNGGEYTSNAFTDYLKQHGPTTNDAAQEDPPAATEADIGEETGESDLPAAGISVCEGADNNEPENDAGHLYNYAYPPDGIPLAAPDVPPRRVHFNPTVTVLGGEGQGMDKMTGLDVLFGRRQAGQTFTRFPNVQQ